MRNAIIIFISLILLASSCSSTPSHVIDEDDMTSLLVDLQKGEAIIEIQSGVYYNDSLKKSLKQSIFIKHGVTQEQFDTSLVWYAHNIEKYIEIYDRVIKNLEEEDKQIIAEAKQIGASTPLAVGDSVDLWGRENMRIFKQNMLPSQMSIMLKADAGFKKGDRYQWAFLMLNNIGNVDVFLGIDYKDGSTSYITKKADVEGWNKFSIQADSTKLPLRVFGYVNYDNMGARDAVYFDSISFVRTRVNPDAYSFIYTQKKLEKKKN